MKRIKTCMLMMLFVFVITACFRISASADVIVDLPVSVTIDEKASLEFIDYLNSVRKSKGLSERKVSPILMQIAKERAAQCCVYYAHDSEYVNYTTAKYFNHAGDDDFLNYISLGENLLWKLGGVTTKFIYDEWAKDAHVLLMLSKDLDYCGCCVGYYHGSAFTVYLAGGFSIVPGYWETDYFANEKPYSSSGGMYNYKTKIPTSTDLMLIQDISNESVYYGAPAYDRDISIYNNPRNPIICSYTLPASCYTLKNYNTNIISITQSGTIKPKKIGTATVEVFVQGISIGSFHINVVKQPLVTQGGEHHPTVTWDAKSAYQYTGKNICPKPSKVLDAYGNVLKEGVDYKVVYENNKDIGTGKAYIEGIGNYSGSTVNDNHGGVLRFLIKDSVNLPEMEGDMSPKVETGKAIKPHITIAENKGNDNEKTLEEGRDYTLTYSNNVKPGVATITAKGIGEYKGTQELTFTILSRELNVSTKISTYLYEGEPLEVYPVVLSSDGEKVNTKDLDITWKNINGPGTATIIVKGKNLYTGCSGKCTFRIVKEKIALPDLQGDTLPKIYTGKSICPEAYITGLVEGVDYKLFYTDNVEKGTATVTAKATSMGPYKGSSSFTFRILDSKLKVQASTGTYVYTGKEIRPEVKVTDSSGKVLKDKYYTVTYRDNIKTGTARAVVKGEGAYKGFSGYLKFAIVTKKTKLPKIKGDRTPQAYTGKSIRPEAYVPGLKEGGDYRLTYTNNRKKGTATVTATGIGAYTGTSSFTFKILSPKLKVQLSSTKTTYNGKAKKPKVKVYNSEGKYVAVKHYTVSYEENRNVGIATVRVTGKGAYEGFSGKATFRINLQRMKVHGFRSRAKGEITVRWKAYKQADGYVVQTSRKRNFSASRKSYVIDEMFQDTLTESGYASGVTYYVRIRPYKIVNGKKWYGDWSKARSVTVK